MVTHLWFVGLVVLSGCPPAPGKGVDSPDPDSGAVDSSGDTASADTGYVTMDTGGPWRPPDTGWVTGTDEECRQRPAGPYDKASFAPSRDCAGCHPNHFAEWRTSSHAYAVTDPVFWAGNELSYESNGIENFCINCHAPIADLTNPDPTVHVSSKEGLIGPARSGISCASCHRTYEVTVNKNLSRCSNHYFGPIADPDRASAPHGVSYAPDYARSNFCQPCHDVNAVNERGQMVQVEATNTEWAAANARAGGTNEAPAIQTCQDCHMPAYRGTAAVGGIERDVHRHTFFGVDIALVPFPGIEKQRVGAEALLRNAARLDLDVVGDQIRLDVTNLIEGHNLPTGSAHARRAWIHTRVVDAAGDVVFESGDLDANGDLRGSDSTLDPWGDPWMSGDQALFIEHVYDAEGRELLAEYGRAHRVEHDTLAAGETRRIVYPLPRGTALRYPLDVTATFRFRPASNMMLRAFALDEELIARVPTFTVAEARTQIDGP